jgi:hypothetical protein
MQSRPTRLYSITRNHLIYNINDYVSASKIISLRFFCIDMPSGAMHVCRQARVQGYTAGDRPTVHASRQMPVPPSDMSKKRKQNGFYTQTLVKNSETML